MLSTHEPTPRLAAKAIGIDKLYYDSKIIILLCYGDNGEWVARGEERLYLLDLPNEIDEGFEVLATGDKLLVISSLPFPDVLKRYGHEITLLPKKPMRFE